MYLLEISGQTYGRITVIDRAYIKNGKSYWNCVCSCGKACVIIGTYLRNGMVVSCGCYKREMLKELGEKHRLDYGVASMNALIGKYMHGAKRRGYCYELTNEQFAKLTKEDCFYCGSPPALVAKSKSTYGEYIYNGLDRVDNTLGYIIDNVVPCCFACNTAKSAMGYDEFIKWVYRVHAKLNNSGLDSFEQIKAYIKKRNHEDNTIT